MMGTGRRDELEDESGKDIEHSRKGESTKEMMGRPLRNSFFRFARMYPDGSWRPEPTAQG